MEERLLGSEAKDDSNLKGRIWAESKKLWRIALPAMLARVSQYGMFVVTQGFIGHIGEVQLAAYALIQIIAVRFANGILLGMSSATETLCGQAFGAKQYHMMGIYLQRSWIINIATGTVLLPIFIFAGDIFKLLGEESDIASEAGYISLWFIPILYFFIFCLTIQKYLQAQLKNIIVGWLSAVAFVIHVLLSWIFVNVLNFGIPGAMSAMIIASWFIVIGEFVYIFGGWCPNTWNGFSLAAFVDLLPVLKLSISSGVMLCLELWYNAILVLVAGYMKNATSEISAFSICLNIISWEFMLCFGFLAGSSVRISNELGKGDAKTAKFSVKVAISTTASIGMFFFIMCLVFSHGIAKIFTSSEVVIASVSSLSVLLAFSVFLNGIQAVLSGVAVGAGRQTVVAYVNICCYYFIGIPVGIILAYVANMKVKGIWIGMLLGVVTQVLVLGYITYKTDWDQQVNEASARLNKWLLKPSDESNGS
ncbi:protein DETOXIFICATION 24-like isoform X2 [Pistacia vera]|uniref:protein DETOXIFICATION 24-like isoform X2 n=1 Tax=Pistacia vera TaxID=55513 RepID=UPI0012635C45|nr:protein DETOXIFICATION 24-like isoform X2 [Pistacia vera]